ncbi:hypothetical protein MNB_SUP05-5-1133 [hydrothermal vent metagenome]|uniref:General secretion pathway GspH domain-containing protein n=1 Tax=hydrothermal vent metagenome TaxID=652676 RepID=A0A1W1CVP9_9ZZZZ
MNAIYIAKSYAIQNNTQTIFCISINQTDCVKTKSWRSNWLIFIDKNNNQKRDNNEEILLQNIKIPKEVSILFNNPLKRITFKNTGLISSNNTFNVCLTSGKFGNGVVFTQTGRYRISNKNYRC